MRAIERQLHRVETIGNSPSSSRGHCRHESTADSNDLLVGIVGRFEVNQRQSDPLLATQSRRIGISVAAAFGGQGRTRMSVQLGTRGPAEYHFVNHVLRRSGGPSRNRQSRFLLVRWGYQRCPRLWHAAVLWIATRAGGLGKTLKSGDSGYGRLVFPQ